MIVTEKIAGRDGAVLLVSGEQGLRGGEVVWKHRTWTLVAPDGSEHRLGERSSQIIEAFMELGPMTLCKLTEAVFGAVKPMYIVRVRTLLHELRKRLGEGAIWRKKSRSDEPDVFGFDPAAVGTGRLIATA